MELMIGTIVMLFVLMALVAIRVSRLASWRALAQVAMASGSFKACVDFIRYCERLS
jgi:hypothetical protein